jgi:hypothetical protein
MPTISVDKYKLFEALGRKYVALSTLLSAFFSILIHTPPYII